MGVQSAVGEEESKSQDSWEEVKKEKDINHRDNSPNGFMAHRRSKRTKDITIASAILGGLIGWIFIGTPEGVMMGGFLGAIFGFIIGE